MLQCTKDRMGDKDSIYCTEDEADLQPYISFSQRFFEWSNFKPMITANLIAYLCGSDPQ